LLDIYWNILTMHGPINFKYPNNIREWQMGFNSVFKGLNAFVTVLCDEIGRTRRISGPFSAPGPIFSVYYAHPFRVNLTN
jgi:hypothetical protein